MAGDTGTKSEGPRIAPFDADEGRRFDPHIDPLPESAPSSELAAGEVLSNRFVVERLAEVGGMGVIHRGLDQHTREAVAIKVMAPPTLRSNGYDDLRFAEEAAVLARLSHPAIVRYVAHGSTLRGAPFMAMEWLDGEDLAARLRRSPLTILETLVLVRRACAAIAAAHALGVVHRDLKPSNLFLVDGDPAALKVLDFGIARRTEEPRSATRSGTVLGTVGYMSPEQAMAARDVDARTDVFALGCVLFECLAGRPAFVGSNPVAVLAKVLQEDPPPLTELRPELDPRVAALVAAMLSKKPDDRPSDAAAVLDALDDLERVREGVRPLARPAKGLTRSERKIVSIVLGKPRAATEPKAASLSRAQVDAETARVRDTVVRFEVEPIWLRNGAWLVVLSDRGAATDQAAHAARCALKLGSERPDLAIAVATGRAETSGGIPVGAVIDRAAELLATASESVEGVAIDELTAGLLDREFDVRRERGELALFGRHGAFEGMRLLMGRPTPFVGRDRELAFLELTLRECIDESVARAVLVTGVPGQGKSRLRHEFVERVRDRGGVAVFVARADPVGAGSAFALVRQLLRHAMALREGAPTLDQRAGLRARVAEICPGPDAGRIADFLGELIGLPPLDDASAQLRAARNDPQIMGVWLRRAVIEWLAAECAVRPVLLVLEDLHWGDVTSVTFLSDALSERGGKPLMLLALARPEVHETFPALLARTDKTELALSRLSPRASERLVRESLGDTLAPEVRARIAEHADGNPFYLEELIRHVASGQSGALPETVLALVQSRLERLEPEARRVIRAASVFGEVFWSSGVAAVLGETQSAALEHELRVLSRHELIAGIDESSFPGQEEFRFRHGLLRDAAYAMLVDTDRATGHRLAGDWLEQVGERDALTLADQFERGGEPMRAAPWLRRASQTALDGGNVDEAVRLGGRAIASGVGGAERGHIHVMHGWALGMRGDWLESIEANRQALDLLPAESTLRFVAAACLLLAGSFVGDVDTMTRALHAVSTVEVAPEASGPYGFAACAASQGLAQIGRFDAARALLTRAEALDTGADDTDLVFVMWLRVGRSHLQLLGSDLGGALDSVYQARDLADRTGSVLGYTTAAAFLVQALLEAGDVDQVEHVAAEALAFCERVGRKTLADWTTMFRAFARAGAGRVPEAAAAFTSLLDRPDYRLVAAVRTGLALCLFLSGRLDDAAREAALVAASAVFPARQASILGLQAHIELRRGSPAKALAFAEKGLVAAGRSGYASTECSLRLARAEALHGLGRLDEARDAIRDAREHVVRIAATLRDPTLSATFSTRLAHTARTLALAKAWTESAR